MENHHQNGTHGGHVSYSLSHHHHNSQHIVYAGWLLKSPPEKRIWKHLGKWRRRWFVLKLSGQIPGQYVLEYYVDQSCKKLKGTIDLDQCEQVDAGLQLEIRKTSENFEFMFDLRTTKRVFYLVASTEEEMNKWVECICSVCGLKIEAIQNELSLLPMMEINEERYSPQPSQSGDSAPSQTAPTPPPVPPPSTQSSISNLNDALLDYIPISDCYSHKQSSTSNSPPPPRPPKPRALQLAGKSQSSLALWPADQPAILPPPHPLKMHGSNTIDLRRSPLHSKSASVNPPVLINDRPLYLNHANGGTPAGTLSLPPHNHQYEFCNANVVVNQNGTFEVPPLVNRDLKPHRRNPALGRSFNESSPFGTQASRHTLPRPPPSYPTRGEDGRKSFNHNHNHHTLTLSHLGLEKGKKSSPFAVAAHQSIAHADSSNSDIQYLDLDLESSESTNSQSPRAPHESSTIGGSSSQGTSDSSLASITQNTSSQQPASGPQQPKQPATWNIPPVNAVSIGGGSLDPFTIMSAVHQLQQHNNNNNNASTPNANLVNGHCKDSSTVYKKVDFVKTKAFNEMRVNMDFYRNSN